MSEQENLQKGINYQEQIKKLNKAIKNEYFYEALIIDYAYIEDRINAILYYFGILNNDDFSKSFKTLKNKNEELKNKNLSLKKISSKIFIIKFIINNYTSNEIKTIDQNLFDSLQRTFKNIDKEDLLNLIEDINNWKDERNNIVHCLMNNKFDELSKKVEIIANDGFVYARKLDSFSQKFKRRSTKHEHKN